MNTHELIESTMLHALGLLDDTEREAYQAAFDAAPVSVQERVREDARRMADLGDLIPEVDPSPELRSMVLAAVRAAMREDENEARIAQTKSVPALSPTGNPVIATINAQGVQSATHRSTSQPKLSSSPRVHRAWRLATMGFAAAAIALGVITISTLDTYKQAQSKALVANLYDTIGAQYLESTIFDANTQRVALTANSEASRTNTRAVAAIWTNPDWDTARLFVKNLSNEQDQPYRLVVLDSDGNIVREIATFLPNGEFQDFDVDVNLSTERSLAIYPSIAQDIEQSVPVLMSSEGTL
ncbi:MAG: hypothetical protein JKX70_10755 [Phycisphaerales bacterium]|nr:hypothetical protein [Phycisphaerales bacterium]